MTDDTIVARATPAGQGGVAIIRVSGPDVRRVASAVLGRLPKPRYALYTDFNDAKGRSIDTGIALFFASPDSFTGEDVLELQGHGGPVVCDILVERVLELGARLAEPGEFSRRAFLNDKLDLSQAEALADLISSSSRSAARAAQCSLQGDFSAAVLRLNDSVTALRIYVEAAIDFPDEEIDFLKDDELVSKLERLDAEFAGLEKTIRQGCLLRDGLRIVLVGRPNAGKSSLLNALAGYDAAIVTDVPGTTRDLVREQIEIDGLPIHVVDTAGLRDDAGVVEREGVRRARGQLELADHALIVVDAAGETDALLSNLLNEIPAGLPVTIVRNKIDLTDEPPGVVDTRADTLNVSAMSGAGIDALRERIATAAGFEPPDSGSMTARRRHLESLRKAREHFQAGRDQLRQHQAGELMADELLQVQNALAEITGEFSSDDLLGEIFSSFCIGK